MRGALTIFMKIKITRSRMRTAVQDVCIDSYLCKRKKIFSIESFEVIQLEIKSNDPTSSNYWGTVCKL